jgi:hypothetical protein
MRARWTVLASGSSGNAAFLERDGAGLLVDLGLGPRQLASRLETIGFGWDTIRGVVLTHTHSDHWNTRSLAQLVEKRIPFFCHSEHLRPMHLQSPGFQALQFAGLVRTYAAERDFSPLKGTRCRALTLRHDGGATFGFRIEADQHAAGSSWAVGYAADLGSWEASLPRDLANVDVLALEFNHDVELQQSSGRARWLINRVLGEFGHLSNVQGATLLGECAGRSTPGRLRHVIQLHLSRECNRPALAVAAARRAIAQHNLEVELHTASQDAPSSTIDLGEPTSVSGGLPFRSWLGE